MDQCTGSQRFQFNVGEAFWLANVFVTIVTMITMNRLAPYVALYTIHSNFTHYFGEMLKYFIDDRTCSHKGIPNNPSGHGIFVVFCCLQWMTLLGPRFRSVKLPLSKVLLSNSLRYSILFVGGAAFTQTFVGGYHSYTQLLLGCTIGGLSHCVLSFLLFSKTCKRLGLYFSIYVVAVLWSIQILLVTLWMNNTVLKTPYIVCLLTWSFVVLNNTCGFSCKIENLLFNGKK